MFASRVRLLVTTLWVGSLWTIGYLVAPALFGTLPDPALAGSIAGTLFRLEAWLSVFCGAVLVALIVLPSNRRNDAGQFKTGLMLVAGMLLCTLIGYFSLHPSMAALREAVGPAGAMTADARMKFGMLHGVSSAIYLIQSLLGAALVFKIR